jgi:hypothetical protein
MTDVHDIPFITVCYNTPELIKDLVASVRQFYPNRIYIIDGSEPHMADEISKQLEAEKNVEQIKFHYNIHHGPGMAWAIDNLNLPNVALFIDSDMFVLRDGFLENMLSELKAGMYGVGRVHPVNADGFDLENKNTEGGIPYLHPALMLCNTQVMRQWPRPIKHGAPMVNAMTAIHHAQKSELLKHIQWVDDDIHQTPEPSYVVHAGRGTVFNSGSYNLDEWMQEMQNKYSNNQTTDHQTSNESGTISLNAFTKMNLGCGANLIKDYLNIGYWSNLSDGVVYKDLGGIAGTFMLNHDLVRGIPAQNESQKVIYHSHFLEHLSYKDGIKLLFEVYEKLTPGGIHRIVVPDMELWIKSYYTKDDFFIDKYRNEVLKDDLEIYAPRGAAFMGMLHNHEHKCGWDFEMLEFHLKRAGFKSIQRTMYQESSLLAEIVELEPYSPLRAMESLCVECIK